MLLKKNSSWCILHVPDHYILDNAPILSGTPVSITHGRFDFVCPPSNAWKLHKRIKGSTIQFVFSGHTIRDEKMQQAIIKELAKFV